MIMMLFLWILGDAFLRFFVVIMFYLFFGIEIIMLVLKYLNSGILFMNFVFLMMCVGVLVCVV